MHMPQFAAEAADTATARQPRIERAGRAGVALEMLNL